MKDATNGAANISYNLPSNTAVSDRSMETQGLKMDFFRPVFHALLRLIREKKEPTETVSNLKMKTCMVAGCWEIAEAKTSREAKTMHQYV